MSEYKFTKFKKNIIYIPGVMAETLRKAPESLIKYASRFSIQRGSDLSSDVWGVIAQLRHMEVGVQLIIQKTLSDELEETDIQGVSGRDIIFPFDSIDFYFEDASIPSFIFQKFSQEYFKKFTNGQPFRYCDGGKEWGEAFIMIASFVDGANLVSRWPVDNVSGFLSSNPTPGPNAFTLDFVENKELKRLFMLAIKVLLYISIPKYKPIQISKHDLHYGGRPGVHNRPRRPIYRTIFVPSEINIAKESSIGEGGPKRPHGRRGYFRMLRDERFKHKRGDLIFVRPCLIHGGSFKDQLYIARKAS